MIRIEENFLNKETVVLKIEGRLDRESLPAFRQMCERYLKTGRKVQLDLGGLNHIGQDGLDFLRSINNRVFFLGLNEYLKIAIQNGYSLLLTE